MRVDSQAYESNKQLKSDVFRCWFKTSSNINAMASAGKPLQIQAAESPEMQSLMVINLSDNL